MSNTRKSTLWRTACASTLLLGAATPAFAQSEQDQPAPGAAPDAVQPVAAPVLPVESAAASSTPYQRFDTLAMKGWERPLPKSADTLIGDKAGIRDALADAGIGFIGFASNAIQYNFLQNDRGYSGP